ncbi:903_t:CDS:2 [Acaulospora colombiana]|uniref:903_t:CDS:1 n=1 Tax=Acaulospora colombiana TaxID=27376 RepID=A0ACA9LRL1_9GLOM|nr:903_t:CDS:2 [Acaulospora colombiana]
MRDRHMDSMTKFWAEKYDWALSWRLRRAVERETGPVNEDAEEEVPAIALVGIPKRWWQEQQRWTVQRWVVSKPYWGRVTWGTEKTDRYWIAADGDQPDRLGSENKKAEGKTELRRQFKGVGHRVTLSSPPYGPISPLARS